MIVHQIDFDDMAQEFHPWDTMGLKTVHLTYHRGRHYNSVRSKKDSGVGAATDFPINHPLMSKAELLPDFKQEIKENIAMTTNEESKIQCEEWDMVEFACNLIDVSDQDLMTQSLKKVFGPDISSSYLTNEMITDRLAEINDAYMEHELLNFSKVAEDCQFGLLRDVLMNLLVKDNNSALA